MNVIVFDLATIKITNNLNIFLSMYHQSWVADYIPVPVISKNFWDIE